MSRSFAFVAASPDTNYHETVRSLKAEIPLPMVGGTSIGNPFDTKRDSFGTSIAFLEKKGLRSAAVLSKPVDSADATEIAEDLLRRAREELGETPKLYLLVLPITENFFADHLVGALYAAAGDIPVFGGMVSDDYNSDRAAVFFDGECRQDRMVLVALGGDISPVFALGRELTFPTAYSPVITEAEGNIVRGIDGMPFGDYLRKFNLDAAAVDEFPISLQMHSPESPDADDEGMVVIDLVKVAEDGSGIFATNVAVGQAIRIATLSRENIAKSTQRCIRVLKERMAEKEAAGCKFDVILAASCIARYYLIIREEGNFEAEALEAGLPGDIGKFGMFAFAEYCPVPVPGGGWKNKMHSQTLIMCAF